MGIHQPRRGRPQWPWSALAPRAGVRGAPRGIGRWKGLLIAVMMAGGVCGILPGETGGRLYAQETTEEMKKRMQQQLNEQIMSKPFSVPDEAQVNTYIEDQKKKGVVPPPYTGRYWRPGYTCYNLARYSHPEYLACRYYYHYYGYYYR